MNQADIEGRLAALEAAASFGLKEAARNWCGTAWSYEIADLALEKMLSELDPTLSDEARNSAKSSLSRMLKATFTSQLPVPPQLSAG